MSSAKDYLFGGGVGNLYFDWDQYMNGNQNGFYCKDYEARRVNGDFANVEINDLGWGDLGLRSNLRDHTIATKNLSYKQDTLFRITHSSCNESTYD